MAPLNPASLTARAHGAEADAVDPKASIDFGKLAQSNRANRHGMQHGLYLIHIEPPYKHAAHYLGYSDNIARRVMEHASGGAKASPLLKAALAAGCKLTVSRIYLGEGRTRERSLKNQGSHKRRCPTCLARGDGKRRPAQR